MRKRQVSLIEGPLLPVQRPSPLSSGPRIQVHCPYVQGKAMPFLTVNQTGQRRTERRGNPGGESRIRKLDRLVSTCEMHASSECCNREQPYCHDDDCCKPDTSSVHATTRCFQTAIVNTPVNTFPVIMSMPPFGDAYKSHTSSLLNRWSTRI